MEIEEAKKILNGLKKAELQDHSFGDVEVSWWNDSKCVATGYFTGTVREVFFNDGGAKFYGNDADELRECFASEVVERNDETGPDEFELGHISPGLTKEAVFKELTE